MPRTDSPLHPLIPDIPFIISHRVFCEESAVFILKCSRPMMRLRVVDVSQQHIEIARPDGEHDIATLPREARQFWRLAFEPFRQRRFQFLDQRGNGDRPRKLNGEVNVIRHASDTRAFAAYMTRNRGEIGMERGTKGCAKTWKTILRAENEVEQDLVERLRIGFLGRAFSPCPVRRWEPGALPQAGVGTRRWRCRNPPSADFDSSRYT